MSLPEPKLDEPATEQAPEDNLIHIPRKQLYAALLPLAFVTGIAAGYLFWGRENPEAAPQAAAALNPAAPAPSTGQVRLDISLDDDPKLGPDDASITIVEFSDFNCPYCVRFHQDTFKPLLEAYPDQIQFVYRDFPVVGGFEAAMASECADDQGFYWEFHDLLFSGGLGTNRDAFRQYGTSLGLDLEELEACLEEDRFAAEVEADAQYAANLGVTGTPTFFINGIPLVGAQPLSRFVTIIEDELNP